MIFLPIVNCSECSTFTISCEIILIFISSQCPEIDVVIELLENKKCLVKLNKDQGTP